MIGTRYEEYSGLPSELPFVFFRRLERTRDRRSAEMNWHEDPEIQLCLEGEGTVLINGVRFPFRAGDLAAVNPNEIHYTDTETRLVYACLIIRADFWRQMGIDPEGIRFSPTFRSDRISGLFRELESVSGADVPFRAARLNGIVLQIMIALCEDHGISGEPLPGDKGFGTVKGAVKYIREHYAGKLSLDAIARAVCVDKYTLCREFKAFTGQTPVSYINAYRCGRAAELLAAGATVSEAATACGFENLSYFTKVFKRCRGILPSQGKRTGPQ